MSDIKTLIREVKAHDAKATPGPWLRYKRANTEPKEWTAWALADVEDEEEQRIVAEGEPNDIALIAHYRTAAPILAAEVERLTAECDELRLTLLAEQGDIRGAPAGWARSGGSWFRLFGPPGHQAEVRRANIHPEGEPWHWAVYTPTLTAEGYAPTAREAMLAADRAWQGKR